MGIIKVLAAALVLVVLHGYATATEHSLTPEKVEEQKFVGTWKGYQGRWGRWNREATYTFWMEQNRLLGKSKYFNAQFTTTAEGILSDISVIGDTIQFLVMYKGGRPAGTKARYKLELKDSMLEGAGHNIDHGIDFDVSLKKVE